MSKIKVQGNASGSGTLTIEAPNTNTDRTITLPDTTGTLVDTTGATFTGGVTGTDVTLSGGLYVGGTGSANYLDDYEEGTWTPSVGGVTVSGATGHYTKVGRKVTVVVTMENVTISGANNNKIENLPFTNGGKRSATSGVAQHKGFSYDHVVGIVMGNATNIQFTHNNSSAAWNGATFRNSANVYVHFSATYFTDY